MKNRIAVLLISLFVVYHTEAQPFQLENYRHQLTEKAKTKGFERDTAYINLLLKFSTSFYAVNPDSMLFYAQKAYGYAKNIHHENGEAECLSIHGYYYSLMGDYTQMLSYFQQAQVLAEKVNNKRLAGNMIRNIGLFYLNTEKTEEALQHLQKAYGIMQELKDSVGKAYLLVDMAGIHWLGHNYDKALELYNTALQVLNDPNGYVAAFIRVDIGAALCEKRQYKEALPYFEPSLQYYLRTNDMLGRMNTTNAMVKAYRGLGDTGMAIDYALESFSLANELKHKEGLTNASESLAGLYEGIGDYRNSLKYFKLYKVYSDSLFNEDTRKKTAELQAKFIYEKKEAQLKETHEKENLQQANHLKVLQLEAGVALLAAILLGIVAVFFLAPRWVRKITAIRDLHKDEMQL
jgi:two-component system, sensor histidine kinase and response regulator